MEREERGVSGFEIKGKYTDKRLWTAQLIIFEWSNIKQSIEPNFPLEKQKELYTKNYINNRIQVLPN